MTDIEDEVKQKAKIRAELLEQQIKAIQEAAIFPVDIKVPTVFGGFTVYHIPGKIKELHNMLYPIKDELLTPTHYVEREAGAVKKWRKTLPFQGLSHLRDIYNHCKKNNIYNYKLGNITFHAIMFGNPIGKHMGTYARWDCINGWTTTLKEIEDMNKSV